MTNTKVILYSVGQKETVFEVQGSRFKFVSHYSS